MRLFPVVALLILIASCKSSETTVKWEKPAEQAEKIKNVMVISLSPLKENRELIEWELVYKLREKGYKTGPSHAFVDGELSEENILKAMDQNGFDGALTLALKGTRTEQQYQRSDRYLSDPNYIYFSNYFDATYGARFNTTVFIVETNGYQRKDEKLIFTSLSESFNLGDLEIVVDDFAKGMTNAIHKAKILEKNKD